MGPYAVVDSSITSLYVDARIDSYIFIMGNPMPESILTLCQSRLYPQVKDLEFGLCNSYNSWEAGSLNMGEKKWLKSHLPKKSWLFTNVFEQWLKRFLFITGENNCSCGVIFVANLT